MLFWYLGVAALVVVYGSWRVRWIELQPVASIAIVQPNIPQE
jgi:hypothetical protein